MIDNIISFFERKLTENRDEERAQKMTAYMKNIQPFFGIPTPKRKEFYKEFKKEMGKEFINWISEDKIDKLVNAFWGKREREYRYVGLFLLDYCKINTPRQLPLLRKLIIQGNWWDTTDSIAIDFVNPLLLNYQKTIRPVIKEWVNTDNLWLRRTAILSQLYFKTETDLDLLQYCITQTMLEKEFFIQKAIGWALREYSKTNPTFVIQFMDKFHSSLSKLSIREGEKYLTKKRGIQ